MTLILSRAIVVVTGFMVVYSGYNVSLAREAAAQSEKKPIDPGSPGGPSVRPPSPGYGSKSPPLPGSSKAPLPGGVAVSPYGGPTWKVTGLIKSVSRNGIVVSGKEKGKETERVFWVHPSTTLKKSGQIISLNDLRAGDSVDITYALVDGAYVADAIVAKP